MASKLVLLPQAALSNTCRQRNFFCLQICAGNLPHSFSTIHSDFGFRSRPSSVKLSPTTPASPVCGRGSGFCKHKEKPKTLQRFPSPARHILEHHYCQQSTHSVVVQCSRNSSDSPTPLKSIEKSSSLSSWTEGMAVMTSFTSISKSTKLRLMVAWIVLWGALLRVCAAAPDVPTLIAKCMSGAGAVALVWLGMVFAISMMEAWVKFTAPLLTKAVGVDVGRTVFGALQAVELVHCGALLALSYLAGEALKSEASLLKAGVTNRATAMAATLHDPLAPLPTADFLYKVSGILLAIVLVQSLYLGPALDQLAQSIISTAPADDIPVSRLEARDKIGGLMRKQATEKPTGPHHKVYGLLEFVKFICLGLVGAWGLGFIIL
eukprot:TRINITY_DN19587_c0_g1_i1.p1 TRINITY_DN19587_c0_g1~~TRINITY_DN19587_c0_g1_i1.p1  ORF type:complete len:395 (+),score=31.97 TRINITY_DN19587_c0_g1_i1:53-1186(+)